MPRTNHPEQLARSPLCCSNILENSSSRARTELSVHSATVGTDMFICRISLSS